MIGASSSPVDDSLLERWLAPARRALSAAAYEQAWTKGQTMTLEQAIEYALAEAPS